MFAPGWGVRHGDDRVFQPANITYLFGPGTHLTGAFAGLKSAGDIGNGK
jgi:hypothetical protein